jgi:flavin-dependent dehydrogenase
MVSGYHAGQTALKALKSGDFTRDSLRRYEDSWQKEIGDELRRSIKIQKRLFTNTEIIDILIRSAAQDPKLRDVFTSIVVGKEGVTKKRFEIAYRLLLSVLSGRIRLSSLFKLRLFQKE